MNPAQVIAHKRDGCALTEAEIRAFVAGVCDGSVPDYQAAALLMAITLRGMDARETLDLTLAMRDSGRLVDLSGLRGGPTLDKHSTGGVGDTTTLIVVPILAACGVPVLKMSGRGLGFSGGTADKLDAIPGLRTALSVDEAREQTARIGAALISQSDELVPADRILYALRDVTATVESLPLIASSIMAKKLAAGAGRILLDVKVGRGAFMKDVPSAEALARMMIRIGASAGVPTSAVLTAMDEPLGFAVGNALEVREAVDILRNRPGVEPRLRELCVSLAAHGLCAVGKISSPEGARSQCLEALESGAAAEKFARIVAAQGGPPDLDALEESLPIARDRLAVLSKQSGIVAAIDAEAIGRLAGTIGAGRAMKSDLIDPSVGIVLQAKTGGSVEPGNLLATLHLRAADLARANEFTRALRVAFRIVAPEDWRPTCAASPVLLVIN